jgi:hypothetical protein
MSDYRKNTTDDADKAIDMRDPTQSAQSKPDPDRAMRDAAAIQSAFSGPGADPQNAGSDPGLAGGEIGQTATPLPLYPEIDPTRPMPTHGTMVSWLRAGLSAWGHPFHAAMQAALIDVTGVSGPDGERLRTLLTRPRNADEAAARCIDVLDNVQGSDATRREVVRQLTEHLA